jgi:ABC-type multidrug transport system fused ATPase/permease subunit
MDTHKKLFQFAKKHPILTSTNMLMSLTFPIDDVLIPYLSGKIVTLVQQRKNFKPFLIILISTMVAMQFFYTATFLHDAYFLPALQNFIRQDMFRDIIEHYRINPSASDLQTGEMLARIVKIPLITIEFLERIKNSILPYCISFIIICTYIFSRNKPIGIVLFLSGILTAYLISTSPIMCASRAHHQEATIEKLEEETEDVLRNLPIVYTSGTINRELTRVSDIAKEYATAFKHTTYCTVQIKFVAVLALSAMLIFFGVYSYRGLKRGTLEIGLFVTIFMAMTQWYTTLGYLTGNIRDIVMEWGILASHQRSLIIPQINGKSTLNHKAQAQAHAQRPGLFIDRISYSVPGRNEPILSDFTMTVSPGERVLIAGAIGSGKSTLLKIVAGILTPTGGAVYLDGKPLSHKDVGYIQQFPLLFNRSIYENVLYGSIDSETDRVRVDDMVQKLGLADAFANLERGLDTRVGKNGSRLSGGQRHLIQVMRMMIKDPPVVLMDEVTASLDQNTKNKLFRVLDVALKGKIALIVTHDADTSGFSSGGATLRRVNLGMP